MSRPPGQLHVPELAYDRTGDEDPVDRMIVGMAGLTLDGMPFPWATVGPWQLRFEDEHAAVLNVSIVVSLPRPEETP